MVSPLDVTLSTFPPVSCDWNSVYGTCRRDGGARKSEPRSQLATNSAATAAQNAGRRQNGGADAGEAPGGDGGGGGGGSAMPAVSTPTRQRSPGPASRMSEP